MWGHPGKKLLFMGSEFGQWREWNETESLDWHLLEDPQHGGVQKLVQELNRLYGPEPALWEADSDPAGFEWIDVDNASENIVAYARRSPQTGREIICVCNFSAVPRNGYQLRLKDGEYQVILNTDAEPYAGNKTVAFSDVKIEDGAAEIDLPALTTLWLAPAMNTGATKSSKKKRATKSTTRKRRITRHQTE
jgi:1,4-alpha-glucan branching enzyme